VTLRLRLPYPPSVNTYWRHPTRGPLAGRHLISAQGREYRAEVCRLVAAGQAADACWLTFTGPLDVRVILTPPDRRRRDIDNSSKALLDSLTHAGVWGDDSQIKRLLLDMHDPDPGNGRAEVTIGPKGEGASCSEP